jgi:tRNA (cmo5U34)-methyltransferase
MNEFDEKARDWDKNKMHTERSIAVASKLKQVIPFRPGMKGLEFGSGTGLLSYYLTDQLSELTLVDTSKEMLKLAEEKLAGSKALVVTTFLLDLEYEDYSGEAVDILYSQMALHHVKEIPAIIRKFAGILKPGGFLAIADLYPEDGSFHAGDPNVHPGFDPEKLGKILQDCGLAEIHAVPCFTIPKEDDQGQIKTYPVFLLTAKK